MGEVPGDWWRRGRRGGEEEEEDDDDDAKGKEDDAKGKEELGFLEFLLPEPTPKSEPGNKQNLGTHRTLALGTRDMCIWAMADQALGLQRLRAPHLIMGFITHKGLFI